MKLTPYPYQSLGADWLARRRRAYLADRMGLGKTIQALLAARKLGTPRTLVVCPASAIDNWWHEIETWAPKLAAYMRVESYASRRELNGGDFDLVISDEAHYMKNHRAKRTRKWLKVAQEAGRAWLLSGTPMPNHPGELFAPVAKLWPQIALAFGIRTYDQWLDMFTHYWRHERWGKRPYAVKNGNLLRPHIERIMLRRTLADVSLDLPPLRVDVSYLPSKLLTEDGNLALTALMQAAQNDDVLAKARRLLGEIKVPAIADQLDEELEERQYGKIVVLGYHHSTLDYLRTKLERHGVVGFDGTTARSKRQPQIDAFNNTDARVFVAQQNAAGIAINLQVASEIVLAEPAWSPDDNAQAIMRIHRIGQDSPCRARLFAVRNSLDQGIMESLAMKTRMQTTLGL